MENNNAIKLIEKLQKNILQDKFNIQESVATLKQIREYSLIEKKPVVTKALRLAYEHLENNDAFLIAIPEDENLEEETPTEVSTTVLSENNLESFDYFLSLVADQSKKNNILDLKAYNIAFLEK